MSTRAGTYISANSDGESYGVFHPKDLPPDPPLELTPEDQDLADKATLSLGRLDGLSLVLPSTALFLYMYVRKEALLSSQIEGTQSSFSELLLSEDDAAPGVPMDDVQEVSNYVAAMQHGLSRLKDIPLSLRLFREIHERLLQGGRGSRLTPGEFRSTQNWIGGSRPGNALFVPPPPNEVIPRLGALERFLHNDPVRTPVLIKAALAHAQFETIHPFLDGNGRLGRLLVTFLLCTEGVLSDPLLYLSLYFKRNRTRYYELLQKVRDEGAWEEWVRFFLEGVHLIASQGCLTAKQIIELFDNDRTQLQSQPHKGVSTGSLIQVHTAMQKKPILMASKAAELTDLSAPTARKCLEVLVELGMVNEITGKKRDKIYTYQEYLSILQEGTEPLKP